jgi:glucokinase
MMERFINKTRVIGVDISLERTTFAIVDIRGHIIASSDFRTLDYLNIDDFVSELSKELIILIEDNGGFESIRSVGVSAPSANFRTGCIENAPNMPWKGIIPLAAMLRDRLGLAVAITNDCKAIAMGEYTFGSAHGMRDFAVITLGHGLGCAFYCHGKLSNGHNGLSGEFGHSCIIPHGRKCECGLEGCLETYAAEKGIIRTAKEMMTESTEPTLMRDIEKLTPKLIVECCEKGDKMAIEVFKKTGDILGLALANLSSMIDPEAIIVTGGIAHAGHWLFDPLWESFDEHIFHNMRRKVKILESTLNGRERDVLGASVLAWNVKEYSLFK